MLCASMFTKLIYSDKDRMVSARSQGVGLGSKGVGRKSAGKELLRILCCNSTDTDIRIRIYFVRSL